MKNVGSIDRTIRIIAGAVILVVGITYESWWGAIGVVPLITATLGWCPAYTVLGINTCGKSSCCGTSSCSTQK